MAAESGYDYEGRCAQNAPAINWGSCRSSLFGFGLSLAVSALTHAAVAGVPETCAGTASGLNHAVVRAAGLVSVALLGSLAAPGMSNSVSVEGVQRALVLCAVIVAAGGVLVGAFVRDNEPGGLPAAD